VVTTIDAGADAAVSWRSTDAIPSLRPGQYVYVRVIQEDGRAAWSSPIFVIEARP